MLASRTGSLSAVTLCDIDDDGNQDLIIGAPQAEDVGLAVGGVYVLFGGGGLGRQIDIVDPTSVMAFHFFGQFAGDLIAIVQEGWRGGRAMGDDGAPRRTEGRRDGAGRRMDAVDEGASRAAVEEDACQGSRDLLDI